MEGRIIKGIAGFYYVYIPSKGLWECKAKGIFRKEGIKPLVGDRVKLDPVDTKEKEGNITGILARSNELIRPAAANIDQAVTVFSVKSPQPNLNLLDRFLIMLQQKKIPCILVFNKCDLAAPSERKELEAVYANSGCRVLFLSALKNQGMEELQALLRDKTSIVAGPSGVGKSSIINLLQSHISMETGKISEKIERGKHTTRHSQLIPLSDSAFIMDTPGFSSLAVFDLKKEELEGYYPEFEDYREECRFLGCSHTHEPDCGVKRALEQEKISRIRYENYTQIYEELKNIRKY
ncbi:MAG: ribosome small subunit-dependent GTPase A [Lachnospiraceae bacterium]|nr:ribosome small subunit-dependent GTPase A [Lachnospiraceae bacterium]